MNFIGREVLHGTTVTTITEMYNRGNWVTLATDNHVSILDDDIHLNTIEDGDFCSIKVGKNIVYSYIVRVGELNCQFTNGIWAEKKDCKALFSQGSRELISDSPIQFDSVGIEYEASLKKVREVKKAIPLAIASETRETSEIYELQMKPIKLTAFSQFLKVYKTIANIDKFRYSLGKNTKYASSAHTHLSTYGDSIKLLSKNSWSSLLSPYLFSKNHGSFKFRSSSILSSRAELIVSEMFVDTKRANTCVNTCIPETTVEYRINENPFPLWVYLVPVLTNNEYLFKELSNSFNSLLCNDNVLAVVDDYDTIVSKELKNLSRKALKLTLTMEPQVLAYWKDKVKNYPLFSKTIKAYFANRLDSKKTLKGL